MTDLKKNRKKVLNNLTDREFGHWQVIKRASDRYGRTYWLCRCKCGNEKDVSSQSLLNGSSTKCSKCNGLLVGERATTHGFCRKKKIPEYHIWNSIKNRCRNKNTSSYKDYGGRGIDIYDEWFDSFELFINYLGFRPSKDHSVDRIDNDKGYVPNNVRWSTRAVQVSNTRKQRIVNSKKFCISQFGRDNNINRFFIATQLNKGLSPQEILQIKNAPKWKFYK